MPINECLAAWDVCLMITDSEASLSLLHRIEDIQGIQSSVTGLRYDQTCGNVETEG